jgi:hypothetical protein
MLQLDQVVLPIKSKSPPRPPESFDEYLESLAYWEKELFRSFHSEAFPEDIIAYLSDPSISASDGSVWKPFIGAFGWILRLPSGKSVTCSGPAFGHRITSYRAEAYGILSYLRFLYRFQQYWQVPVFPACTILCDNQALVNRLTTFQSPTIPSSLDPEFTADQDPLFLVMQRQPTSDNISVLAPEWDILSTIQDTILLLRHQNAKVQFEFIPSHQDDATSYDDLPAKAKLNVDADHIATQFQRDNENDERNVAPMLPKAGVQLHLRNRDGFDGGTVTHKLTQSVRFADTAPALRMYILKRNKWTPDVFDSMIDWEAHSQALNRNNAKTVHLIKLIHDILPTNHIAHHYIPERLAKCPSCSCEREDRDHVFQCPHSDRSDWRRKSLQAIRKVCDNLHTAPELIDILLDGLSACFTKSPFPTHKYSQRFAKLFDEQTTIGWRQLFNGRLSKEWANIQQQYLVSSNQVDKFHTGQLWSVQIICTIWRHWFEVWDIRNKVIHGKDKSTRDLATRQRLKYQLEALYALQDAVCPHHRDKFFELDIETHLLKTNNQLDNWIRINSGPIHASIKQADELSRNSVRAIETYFRRVNTTRNQPPLHQRQSQPRSNPTAAQNSPTASTRARSSRRNQSTTKIRQQRARSTRQVAPTSQSQPTTNNQRRQSRSNPQQQAPPSRIRRMTQQAIHSFLRRR